MRLPRAGLVAVLLLLVVALAGAGLMTLSPDEPVEVTASFTDTTGLYVGNEVSVLGVPVGEVTAIEPEGRTVEVTMALDEETPLPADAGAVILQSSLVADRYVELTPAYEDGPRLQSGDHIGTDRTRSPANIDDITRAIDELVVALDETTPGGKDLGDLLSVSADGLDGQGRKIRDGLVAAESALRTVNTKEADLTAVTENLDVLVGALARRDRTIRRFEHNVTASTAVLADQREELHATLRSLAELSDVLTRFVKENRELVGDDLRSAADTLELVAANQAELAETFDLAPLVAENISRAWDPETRRLRIKVDARETGPFSDLARAQICRDLDVTVCHLLLNKDGTGLLDPIFDLPTTLFPESF
jgi:phospholipid/cholesterol/gamma-HCH transport system substrate-binding protein